jgi:predicted dehydrogenase
MLGILPVSRFAHGASGGGPLRLALVGCGGRGSGAANQALNTSKNVKLVAVAELFPDRVESALKNLSAQHPDQIDVPKERQFFGFDAYKPAIAECDVVILATPCTFRPQMFEEAVRQGKHSFIEKPVAVDAPGVRRVLAAAEEAKKNLKIGVGLQRRHKPGYIEIVKRLQDGAIGQMSYFRTYFNMGAATAIKPRQPGMSELEFQLRNQFHFAWQCGDIHVDQGLHNVDVINWIKDSYPIRAQAIAGAEVRRGPGWGSLLDHFSVQYEYADGTRLFAENRQIPGTWSSISEHAHGPGGVADMNDGRNLFVITGGNPWRYQEEKPVDPYQREHDDLFTAIVNDQPYNEAERGALSTMTTIMGRMAGYTGQQISWEDALRSEESMAKEIRSLDDQPPVVPDESGAYPLPGLGKGAA